MLGLWLIAAPFVLGVTGSSLWNAVIVGVIIASLGGYNWYQISQGNPLSKGSAGTNAVLGAWLIAAPFVFAAGSAMMWNNVIAGLLVLGFGWYNAANA